MQYRYRSQGPFMDVHFKHGPSDEQGKQVARLWFNEDGDLDQAEFY